MVESTVTIQNPIGLHARPAALLVQGCGRFPCQIWIQKGDKRVDAKSILGVMSLAVQAGEAITIFAEGEQEQQAVNEIAALIESGLGE